MSTGKNRLIKIEIKITEAHSNPNGVLYDSKDLLKKKKPFRTKEWVSCDSDGSPKFFGTHRAVRDVLYKLIEWDYMNAPTMFWTIAHHDKFTNELFKMETLTYDPEKLNGKR